MPEKQNCEAEMAQLSSDDLPKYSSPEMTRTWIEPYDTESVTEQNALLLDSRMERPCYFFAVFLIIRTIVHWTLLFHSASKISVPSPTFADSPQQWTRNATHLMTSTFLLIEGFLVWLLYICPSAITDSHRRQTRTVERVLGFDIAMTVIWQFVLLSMEILLIPSATMQGEIAALQAAASAAVV